MHSEDIENMSAPEKAKLFSLLRNDKELQEYLSSNDILKEELTLRDAAYAEGKLHLTSRQELSNRLKKRRDAL